MIKIKWRLYLAFVYVRFIGLFSKNARQNQAEKLWERIESNPKKYLKVDDVDDRQD